MSRVLRPPVTVLPDAALVPRENLVGRPNRFTHRLKVDQPFYFGSPHQGVPDGLLAAGTKVLLTKREGADCRVVDGRGLSVATAFDGLEPIRSARGGPRPK